MEKTVQKVPFLRLAVALSAGILGGSIVQMGHPVLFGFLLLFFGILLRINSFYSYNLSIYFGTCVHLFFIGAGILIYSNYNKKPEFYNNGKFIASVQEITEEKHRSFQSVLMIHGFIQNDSLIQTKERVMVLFEKDDESKAIKPGQMIVFNQSPNLIRNNNNPYEFDYKKYLSGRKIYRQVYLPSGTWVPAGQLSMFSLSVLAEKARFYFLDIFAQQNWTTRELEVISALTLGYKRGLDPETKKLFTSAGVMHVLAVSGLHVGILFLILSCLLGFLNKQRGGRILFILLIILFLWSFAFVTGLSPSVKRAATMFTFVVVGRNLKRQVNIYNSLAASAFFLLLFNPNNLFDAGFQLSYLAVFGIVFLQPRFSKLVYFRYKFARYFWNLFTVSVAAQISTFPIAVFYFHQFPLYFWVSNMVVLPAVTVLIPLGIALLTFSGVSFVSELIAEAAGVVLSYLFKFLELIEHWPHSVVPLHFTGLELVFILAVLLSLFFFIESSRNFHFKSILVFFLLFLTTSLGIRAVGLFRSEFIVYNYSGQYVAHFISGKRNYVVTEEALNESDNVHNLIKITVNRLQIEPPVYLTCSHYHNDSILYLNNGLIGFDGKVIHFNATGRQIESPFVPDVVVGITTNSVHSIDVFPVQIIMSDFMSGNNRNRNNYNLKEQGAYRVRW